MVVSNPKEIILQWRDFYQVKKVENKVVVVAVMLWVFRFCLLAIFLFCFALNRTQTHMQSNLPQRQSKFLWFGVQKPRHLLENS